MVNTIAIGFDIETFPGLDPWHPQARIRMAMLSIRPGVAYVVQAGPNSELPGWLLDICANPMVVKAGSNCKYDARWMARFGYRVCNLEDTSVNEHVIDGSNTKKDLKSLTFTYLPRLGDYSRGHRDLVRERGGWEHVADNEQYQYAGGDAEASIAAMQGQHEIIAARGLQRPHRLLTDVYQVLAKLEQNGSCIDMEENARLDKLYGAKLVDLRGQITEVLGPINPNSPDQLAEALARAIPTIDLTVYQWRKVMKSESEDDDDDDEEISTCKAILEREAAKHPVVEKVLEFRRYRTRHSTFIAGVRDKHAVEHGGRVFIHPTYRADIARTYRLSSQHPNGQNIPRLDADPELSVKNQFVSRFTGGKVAEADQSQVELRVVAEQSQDKAMLRAITMGEDIHRSMAALMYGRDLKDVTDDLRQNSKTNTFAILYGAGLKKMAAQLKCSKKRAAEIKDHYFSTFPDLDAYIRSVHAFVRRNLYVETSFGFRREFLEPQDWDSPEGWAIYRQAFNTMVQSPAACLTYVGMIVADELLADSRSVMEAQIHDSIREDCFPGEEEFVVYSLKRAQESAAVEAHRRGYLLKPFGVPLVCEVKIGDRWGTAVKAA